MDYDAVKEWYNKNADIAVYYQDMIKRFSLWGLVMIRRARRKNINVSLNLFMYNLEKIMSTS